MSSSRGSSGPSTGRGLSGCLWRAAVALLVPPLVTLAVFVTGFGINRIQTDYAQFRFLVTLLLCGPVAPACGIASAIGLCSPLRVSRSGWVLAGAVIAANLVTVPLVWSRAFSHFVGLGWG